jgi:hypothetical protein
MKKLIGLAVVSTFVAGSAAMAFADDGGPNFTMGAAASYVFDINDPDPQDGIGDNAAAYSTREQDESFNIDLVQIGVTGGRGSVTYGVKLNWGDLAADTGGADFGKPDSNDEASREIELQEAFLAVDAGALTITAGRMPTPIGYEVLEPWGNTHISRSRAWTMQPVNHDGLAISGSTGSVSGMLGVVNGFYVTDNNEGGFGNNIDDEYGVIASVGANFGDIDVNLAGIYTEEADAIDVYEVNAIVAGVFGNCNAALEVTYLDADADDTPGSNATGSTQFVDGEQFLDVTAYFDVHNGPWTLGLRASYSDETNTTFSSGGFTTGSLFDQDFENDRMTVSITGGYEITEGVMVRTEYRHEESDENIFGDDDSGSNGLSDSLDVLQAQILWMP